MRPARSVRTWLLRWVISGAGTHLLSPTKLWVSLMTLAFLVLGTAAWRLYETSAHNNRKVAAIRSQVLIRAGFAALEMGDYRAFVETLGNDFKDLWTRIDDGVQIFESGQRNLHSHCSVQHVSVDARGSKLPLAVTLCQPFIFPRREILTLLAAFAFIALAAFVFVQSIERATLRSLVGYLKDSGISTDDSKGLFGVLSRLRSMAGELTERRQNEIQMAKLSATGELAAQLAHDIRSPMAALQHLLGEAAFPNSRGQRLAETSFGRMQEIADSLLNRQSASEESLTPQPLYLLLQEAIHEKTASLQNFTHAEPPNFNDGSHLISS